MNDQTTAFLLSLMFAGKKFEQSLHIFCDYTNYYRFGRIKYHEQTVHRLCDHRGFKSRTRTEDAELTCKAVSLVIVLIRTTRWSLTAIRTSTMIELIIGALAIILAAMTLYITYEQLKQSGWKWRQKRSWCYGNAKDRHFWRFPSLLDQSRVTSAHATIVAKTCPEIYIAFYIVG